MTIRSERHPANRVEPSACRGAATSASLVCGTKPRAGQMMLRLFTACAWIGFIGGSLQDIEALASENITREVAKTKRGADLNTTYAVSDVDTVNLFSGSLGIDIPIGPAMRIGPVLGYQLHVVYAASPWDYVQRQGQEQAADGTIEPPEIEGAFAYPSPDLNAGLGWRLSLGELLPPDSVSSLTDPLPEPRSNHTPFWTFVDAGGARHSFFTSPVAGADTSGQSERDAPVLYSRDGTHLRLQFGQDGNRRIVEHPDGTVYEFTCGVGAVSDYYFNSTNPASERCWRLSRIYDARGGFISGVPVNRVDVAYLDDGGPGRFRRELVDSFKRMVIIRFQASSLDAAVTKGPASSLPGESPGWVTSVEFPALEWNGSSNQPAVATYAFNYGETSTDPGRLVEIARGCHPVLATLVRVSGQPVPTTTKVALLERITFPDGSSFGGFEYEVGGSATSSRACSTSRDRLVGMQYPTGARVHWSYGYYSEASSFCHFTPQSGDDAQPSHMRSSISKGVIRKTVSDRNGRVLNDVAYLPEAVGEKLMRSPSGTILHTADICDVVHRQATTTVLDQRGMATVHYFDTFNEAMAWGSAGADIAASSVESGWRTDEYAHGFTRYAWRMPDGTSYQGTSPVPQTADRLYLQSETFDCLGSSISQALASLSDGHQPTLIDGTVLGAQTTADWRNQHSGFWRPSTVAGCRSLIRAHYGAQESDLAAVAPITTATVLCTTASGFDYDCDASNARTTASLDVVPEGQGEEASGTRYSAYTGFGQFAQTRTFGPSVSSANAIATTTNYRWVLPQMPAATDRWRLTDVSETLKVQNGQSVRTLYWVDPDSGFLLGTRLVRSLDGILSSSGSPHNDVFVRYAPDPNGFAAIERRYGSDLQPIGLPGNPLSPMPSMGVAAYQTEYTYQSGTLATTAQTVPTAAPAGMASGNHGSVLLRTEGNTIDTRTGIVVRTQGPNGVGTDYGYDVSGRLMTIRNDGLTESRYTYCVTRSDGFVPSGCDSGSANAIYVASTAPQSDTVRSANFYDDWGRLVETQHEYVADGSVEPAATRAGRTCTWYGLASQVDATLAADDVPPAGAMTTGATCPSTWPGGRSTVYSYDVQGRVLQVTSPNGDTATTSYNGDRVVESRATVATPGQASSATKRISQFDYLHRLELVKEPSREGSSAGSACLSLQDESSGGCMVQTNYAYDVNAKLVEARVNTTQPAPTGGAFLPSQDRRYSYDALGWLQWQQLPEMIDDSGHKVIQYAQAYDALGTATQVLTAQGSPGSPGSWGNPQQTLRTLQTTLDGLGREIATRVDGKLIMEKVYASANAGTPVDRKAGQVVLAKRHNYGFNVWQDFIVSERYRYQHPAGFLTQTTLSAVSIADGDDVHGQADLAFTSSIQYDPRGNVAGIGYPSCSAWDCADAAPVRFSEYGYARDHMVRVLDDTEGGSRVLATFGYYPNGMLKSIAHELSGKRVFEDWAQDGYMQRVGGIRVADGGGGVLFALNNYTYDHSGNLISVQRENTTPDQYRYDLVGRLLSGTVSGGGQAHSQTARYDRFGNLLQLGSDTNISTFAIHGASNRVAAESGPLGDRPTTYDAFGNMIGLRGSAMEYDALNMLDFYMAPTDDGGTEAESYAYGPGNLRAATYSDQTQLETWTLRGNSGQMLREMSRDAEGQLQWKRDTIYFGSRPLVALTSNSDQEELHFFVDHLGSTRLVTDAAGTKVAEFDYLPFGQYAREDYFLKDGAGDNVTGPLRFTGHERDHHDSSGGGDLDYMKARPYSPSMGRFLAVDTVDAGWSYPQALNKYVYADNKPASLVDLTGHASKTPAPYHIPNAEDQYFDYKTVAPGKKPTYTSLQRRYYDDSWLETRVLDRQTVKTMSGYEGENNGIVGACGENVGEGELLSEYPAENIVRQPRIPVPSLTTHTQYVKADFLVKQGKVLDVVRAQAAAVEGNIEAQESAGEAVLVTSATAGAGQFATATGRQVLTSGGLGRLGGIPLLARLSGYAAIGYMELTGASNLYRSSRNDIDAVLRNAPANATP